MTQWQEMADKLHTTGTTFVIEPCTRFKGEVDEQATMFFLALSGNAIEFEGFANLDSQFAKQVASGSRNLMHERRRPCPSGAPRARCARRAIGRRAMQAAH
jgi:hypothetical protein